MKNKSSKIKIVLSVAFCVVLTGCIFFAKTVELNKEFNLKKNESAKVSGTNLHLKVKSTGHDISENGESAYCNIETIINGALSDRSIKIGQSITIDDIILKATGVDEPINCTFLVIKNIREEK